MHVFRVFLACVVSMLVASLYAQEPYGRLTGRVVDSANAVVPGARVRVINIETNVVISTVSDSQGNYDARNLIPGQYSLEVETQGFKLYQRKPIEVRVGDAVTVNVALEIGAMTETVTVTAEAPLVDSASASRGQVVENRALMDIPTPNAIVLYHVQATPGVVATTCPTCGYATNAPENVSGLSVGGVRNNSSEFLIDGVPNMKGYGVINLQPAAESLQEVRVQTSDYDASTGHFTGAVVNMVTKSGTNALHGVLTYRYSDQRFQTHPFFGNQQLYDLSTGPVTQQKINTLFPPNRMAEYRATLSGPVYIPKIYNGRNRTFFTYSVDSWINPSSYLMTETVPTPAERKGDFSALLALGPQYQIYDPASIALAPGGLTSRQPLPGNIIPANRIDPMATRLLAYFPLPNKAAVADGTNNVGDMDTDHNDQLNNIVRVDHTISQNNRLSASFTRARENTPYEWQSGFSDQFLAWRYLETDYKGSLDNIITLRPDLVVTLRYGLTRVAYHDMAQSAGFNLATAGFPASLVSQLDGRFTAFPSINISGYSTIGNGTGNWTAHNSHFLNGGAMYNRANHILRFGAEYRIYQNNSTTYGNVSPSMTFDSTWTAGPLSTSSAAPIGQGMAAFLLGLPSGGGISRNGSTALQSGYLGLFAQDDWKVSRKLTISWGLRWEIESPTTERYNRAIRGYDFTTANPIQAAAQAAYALNPIPEIPVSAFQTTGGLLYAGVNGVPSGMWNPDNKHFAPRIGLAYALGAKTAVRAGYGIYFETLGADRYGVSQPGYSQTTSLIPSLDNGLTFQATLDNPFPNPLLKPVGNSLGLLTSLGNSVSFTNPDRRPGYVQNWSMNIQHELPARVLLDVGYAGNRATGLDMSQNLDLIPEQYLSRSPVRDQATINYLAATFPNPFYGMPAFAGSSLTAKTMARSALLRPYPQFTGVTTTLSAGFSWYHSLQVRAEKRLSHGLLFQASYTWSKLMDASSKLNAQDPFPQHVVGSYDRPQHVVVTGIYELPVGKGKYWLSGAPGWANHAIGGWSVQAMYQAQSGAPLSWGNILFQGDIHNIVLPRSERTINEWFNTNAGFNKISSQQLSSNVLTFPTRLTGVRAPGLNNWDMSLFKNFKITEKVAFQLRAEAVDALNHPLFNGPSTSPTSLTFGQITGSNGQRSITLGAKLEW